MYLWTGACRAAAMAVAVILVGASAASAKPARCFSTDDGYFNCDFRGLDRAGSFRIRAPGYPTYTLEMDQPGFAFGYADFGSGGVALPGKYVRSHDDGACWNNPETGTRICAW
jgi:hypothetical protein